MFRSSLLSVIPASLFFLSACVYAQTGNACDLNLDGSVTSADVQAAVNMILGLAPCTADVAGTNLCDVVVVQRVVNAANGAACLTTTGLHSVALTWTASTSSGIAGYKIYRGTTSGGPYTLVASVGNVTTYTDSSVLSGQTYFYVATARDTSGNESVYSTESKAVVPNP